MLTFMALIALLLLICCALLVIELDSVKSENECLRARLNELDDTTNWGN